MEILRYPDGTPYPRPPVTVTVRRTIVSRGPLEPNILTESYKPKGKLRLAPDLSVRLLGEIAGGDPIDPSLDADQLVPLPGLVPPDGFFFVRIVGDSMLGPPHWIAPGDVVLCRQVETARNGQIVAVLLDGGTTLKRFYRERGRIRLVPLNPSHQPIVLEGERARGMRVQGKAVSIHRGLNQEA